MSELVELLREAAQIIDDTAAMPDPYLDGFAERCRTEAVLLEAREPAAIYGCHVEVDVGEEVLGDCVLDVGRPQDCSHCTVNKIKRREDCVHWLPWKSYPPASAVPSTDCIACEGSPSKSNNPCALCSRPHTAAPQTTGALAGWKIMPFSGTDFGDGSRWEIYDETGSGGAVDERDVRDWAVRKLLDRLAQEGNS